MRHQVTHVYFSVLRWFPVLGLLRNPIVYTVSATLDRDRRPTNLVKLNSLARIVVSNERDADTLQSWGLANYELIPPGFEMSNIARQTLPLGGELTLLMASAPWHERHFDLKGVDVLLEAAATLPHVKLILLWRGMLVDELAARIGRHRLEGRVEIVNEKVAIERYLARAHATVLLAKEGYVVKSYPHSLMESLAAGKPVLLSDKIPMADYVRRHGCGVVAENLSLLALIDALELLKQNYDQLVRNTAARPPDAFSVRAMIEKHRDLYAAVARGTP